ncbi:MAG: hypothetical protein IK152_04270 [Lachnospiraceae bacterium]|nr:hypothetical protein [Lachnospiraceae bacterium]
MSNDISSLFGKTNGISGMVSDYNSIKNGSYGKLMKSYYNGNTANKTKSSNRGNKDNVIDRMMEERKNPTVSKEVTEANSGLNSSVKDLTSALSSLQSKDTYKAKEGGNATAVKSLKDFVSAYNNTVENSKKSSLTNISKNVAGIMDAVKENKSALSELGININNDGTLAIDEKKIEAADTSKIQDLFDGDKAMSLGSKAASRLNRAASYTVNEDNAATAADDAAKVATTANSGSLMDSITGLKDKDLYATTTDKEGNKTYDVDAITSAAEDFIKYYNATLNSARNANATGVTSNLSSMVQKTAQNSGDLAEIGINVGTDGKLSMDKTAFKAADMSQVQDTFDQYASAIESDARLLNYYSSTGAGAASGYSADGNYMSAGDLVAQMYDNMQ